MCGGSGGVVSVVMVGRWMWCVMMMGGEYSV